MLEGDQQGAGADTDTGGDGHYPTAPEVNAPGDVAGANTVVGASAGADAAVMSEPDTAATSQHQDVLAEHLARANAAAAQNAIARRVAAVQNARPADAAASAYRHKPDMTPAPVWRAPNHEQENPAGHVFGPGTNWQQEVLVLFNKCFAATLSDRRGLEASVRKIKDLFIKVSVTVSCACCRAHVSGDDRRSALVVVYFYFSALAAAHYDGGVLARWRCCQPRGPRTCSALTRWRSGCERCVLVTGQRPR